MRVLKWLTAALSIASLIAVAIFLNFDLSGGTESKALLPVLNTFFLGMLPFSAAFFAARTYLKTNVRSTLFMSCGLLVFGLGSTIAGWLDYLPNGANFTATVHGICASIGAALQMASGMWMDRKERPYTGRRTRLIISIVGVILFTCTVGAAAVFHVVPPFILGGEPTELRKFFLFASILFFFTSAILYLKQYLKLKQGSLYWYSASLALTAAGILALSVQQNVGDAVCWIGRADQYAGGVFALVSVLALRQEARERRMDIPSIMADFFSDAESGYRNLVETSSDAILSVDADYHIFFSNSAAEKMLGYTNDEIRKISFLDLLVHDSTREYLHKDTLVFRNSDPDAFSGKTMEIELKGKGERQFQAELSLSIRKLPSGPVFTYIIRDITRRKRNAARIQRQNTILNAINRIYENAVTCTTMEELGNACLSIIQTITESRIGFIGETGSDGLFHDIAISENGWEACKLTDRCGHRRPPGNFKITGLYGKVLKTGRSILTNDPCRHPEGTGIPEGHPVLSSFLGVPFIRDGKAAGMMAVANREGGYDGEDQEILETLAPTILEVILRKRAEEDLRRSESLLRTLIEGSPDPIFLKDTQSRIVAANTAYEEKCAGRPGKCVGKDNFELFDDAETARYITAEDRNVMDSGKGQIFEDTLRCNGAIRTLITSKVPWHDENGSVMGLVCVMHDITDRKNLELQLQMLYKVAGKLLASERPQNIVDELCTDVMQFLDCQSFFNYLAGSDEILRLNAYKGIPAELLPEVESLRMGEALCGSVAQSRQRRVVGDIQSLNDPVTGFLRELGIRAYACHPLMDHDRAIGTLAFCTKTRDRFKDGELALMKAVADHVATAISHAEAENRILEMNRELMKKSQLITDFFTNVSHEFKTPLSIILIELELMEYHIRDSCCGCTQDVRKITDVMRQNSYRLSRLIQNLLDVTKIDAGFMNVNLRDADIILSLRELAASVSDFAKNAGISVQFISDMARRHIPMDMEKTERIMLNLLSNAIKYTSPGGQITVKARNFDDRIVISVKDTGEGIPKDKKEIIFDRFRQVNTSLTRNTEGSGIGLSLTKALVELLRGRIWFESEGGKGSEFFIELPILPFDRQLMIPEIEGMSMMKKVEMELSDIRKLETV